MQAKSSEGQKNPTQIQKPHLKVNLKTEFYMPANKFLIIVRTTKCFKPKVQNYDLKANGSSY